MKGSDPRYGAEPRAQDLPELSSEKRERQLVPLWGRHAERSPSTTCCACLTLFPLPVDL